jgi:hypothetical protein
MRIENGERRKKNKEVHSNILLDINDLSRSIISCDVMR